MGKSVLIELLVAELRSRKYNVIVVGSSALAARLIGGFTVHSAFKLNTSGNFDAARLKMKTEHWLWLSFADVIIIDEISMLPGTALRGVHQACTYVMSKGQTQVSTGRPFGGKSVIAVGDLFQLPAVEKYHREDQARAASQNDEFRHRRLGRLARARPFVAQVWQSTMWSRFRFLELTENCRQREDPRWATMLSHLRTRTPKNETFTDEDRRLLEARLCTRHAAATEVFVDEVPEGRGGRRPASTTRCKHCPVAVGGTVLAALRAKVQQLNDAYVREVARTTSMATVRAEDVRVRREDAVGGGVSRKVSESLTQQLSGFPPYLDIYQGMRAILTVNRDVSRSYINGVFGVIEEWWRDDRGKVATIAFRVDGAREPLLIRRQRSYERTCDGLRALRITFPLIPAHAVTVHRVQGATIENELHILLNSEFFARGQAYVALGRTRRPEQIHLWALDYDALYADADVVKQYVRLRSDGLRLTPQIVDAAADRAKTRLAPLDACFLP